MWKLSNYNVSVFIMSIMWDCFRFVTVFGLETHVYFVSVKILHLIWVLQKEKEISLGRNSSL